jgi:hypothetical protein
MSDTPKRVIPSFPDKRQYVRRLRSEADDGNAVGILGLLPLDHLDALPVDRRPASRTQEHQQ